MTDKNDKIQAFINGYLKCIEDLQTTIEYSKTTHNNLTTPNDFVLAHNDVVTFIYQTLQEVEQTNELLRKKEEDAEHQLYVIEGGKKE